MRRRTALAVALWALLLATVPVSAAGLGGHSLVGTTEASLMEELGQATIDPERRAEREALDEAEAESDTTQASTTTGSSSTTSEATTTLPSSSTGSLPPVLDTTSTSAEPTPDASASTPPSTEPPVITVPDPPATTLPEPELPPITVPPAPDVPAVDQEFLDDTNAQRSTTLQWSGSLAAYARAHLEAMVAHGDLFHSDLGAAVIPGGWVWLGENVGKGPTQDAIQSAYMESPTHADNVTFPTFTHMGSASTTAGGLIWTVQIYGARG